MIDFEKKDAVEPTAVDLDSDDSDPAEADEVDFPEDDDELVEPTKAPTSFARVLVFGLLPAFALLLAGAAAFLKWQDSSMRNAELARVESMQAAKDATIGILSYQPDTVEQELNAARSLLTGTFLTEYTELINQMVIPGSQQDHISTTINIPAVASVSASEDQAVVLVYVNQTMTIGDTPPSSINNSVNVTLEKVGDRWLVSKFEPI